MSQVDGPELDPATASPAGPRTRYDSRDRGTSGAASKAASGSVALRRPVRALVRRSSRRRSSPTTPATPPPAIPATALPMTPSSQPSPTTAAAPAANPGARPAVAADHGDPSPRFELSGEPAPADARVSPNGPTYFEQAVEQHSRRLLAIARAIIGYRASPEDVVQQALTNLYKHRDRYDWRQPGGLLKRATVNEALRLLRPPKASTILDDQPADDVRLDRHRAPESSMETRETVRKVREAIDQLPDHFRAALVLCEYEGMSYAQIAETLECSIPQVKTWLHRARRKLAGMLESYVEGEPGR